MLAGVLRDFPGTWPFIEADLVKPNEKAGYRFTIVLHTTFECSCSQNHDTIVHARSEKKRRGVLRRVFGRRNFTYVDSRDTCTSSGHGVSVHSYFNESRWMHCGAQHFAARSVQTLDMLGPSGREFSKVIVMRPDLLIWKPNATVFLLDRVCGKYPGVNVVTGRCDEQCTGFHWNDFDMAWLLCDGRERQLFRDALASVGKKCEGRACEEGRVRLPGDFHSMRPVLRANGTRGPEEVAWSCGFEPMMCRTLQLFAEREVRFGTLEQERIYVGKNQDGFRKCRCH